MVVALILASALVVPEIQWEDVRTQETESIQFLVDDVDGDGKSDIIEIVQRFGQRSGQDQKEIRSSAYFLSSRRQRDERITLLKKEKFLIDFVGTQQSEDVGEIRIQMHNSRNTREWKFMINAKSGGFYTPSITVLSLEPIALTPSGPTRNAK